MRETRRGDSTVPLLHPLAEAYIRSLLHKHISLLPVLHKTLLLVLDKEDNEFDFCLSMTWKRVAVLGRRTAVSLLASCVPPSRPIIAQRPALEPYVANGLKGDAKDHVRW